MKRDRKFVIFIIVISFAVTGVLHYMRSPETQRSVPYLVALESSLCVFGKAKTNEFDSLNSQLKTGIEDNVIPIGYFVEEQRIIEEFDNEKQNEPFLCRDKSGDYVSFYISLTNDMNLYSNARGLNPKEPKLCNTILSGTKPHQSIRTVKNNHRITHKIMANDSLCKLAKKYYNDESKWRKIYQANKNKMPNPNSLKIGQELLIPNITILSKADRSKIVKT